MNTQRFVESNFSSELGKYGNVYYNSNLPQYMKPKDKCPIYCPKTGKDMNGKTVSNKDVVDHNISVYLKSIDNIVKYNPTELKQKTARHLNENRRFKRTLEDMRCASAGGDP